MLSNPRNPSLSIRLRSNRFLWLALLCIMIAFVHVSNGLCAPVDMAKARLVARNTLQHHLSLYGEWNGSATPSVGSGEEVLYQGVRVAYNFAILPSGHVLVALDDELSPVPLYSTRSSFHSIRAGQSQAIESWIVPEQNSKNRSLERKRRAAGVQNSSLLSNLSNDRIARAWTYFTDTVDSTMSPGTPTTRAASAKPALERAATVGPLLTTRWGQDTPFNLLAPADTGCSHTLTGCVATAWAQVLNYWQWPEQGVGSHSYTWNGQTLSVDFSASTYDWANMADSPDGSNSAENDAISKLIYDLAVAAETDFGCSISSSEKWADDVLDVYFNYKAMSFQYRFDHSAEEWFALFKTELDAAPDPRPVILSIFSTLGGGHEVVVDGYQTDTTNLVHINFGWPNLNYDGYYDVTDDFDALYTWDGVEEQYIVTGIEPNRSLTLPTVTATCDPIVDERTLVTLTGSAEHIGYTIESYQWRRVDQPAFLIADDDQPSASFTAPSVTADTTLVFSLKVVDNARNVGYDECTIRVRDIDPPPTPPASLSGDGGGGGGGCFIESLFANDAM